jgi:hypothetical protein
MNAFAQVVFSRPRYRASTKRLQEPFVPEMYEVFRQLELLAAHITSDGPSLATIEWAKYVLLSVLPRKYLIGAQVSPLDREIHVTWDNDDNGKRVVVFFPAPSQLKLYCEWVKDNKVVEHELVNTTSPGDVSERLHWFCQ